LHAKSFESALLSRGSSPFRSATIFVFRICITRLFILANNQLHILCFLLRVFLCIDSSSSLLFHTSRI
jgi:hypothetical protein